MQPCLVVSGTEAVSCGFFFLVSALPGERCSSVLRIASIDESEFESSSSSSHSGHRLSCALRSHFGSSKLSRKCFSGMIEQSDGVEVCERPGICTALCYVVFTDGKNKIGDAMRIQNTTSMPDR